MKGFDPNKTTDIETIEYNNSPSTEEGAIDMFVCRLYKYHIENWEEEKKEILKALPGEKNVKEYEEDIHTDFFDNSRSRRLPTYADLIIDIVSPCIEDLQSRLPGGGDTKLLIHQCWMGVDNMWYQTEYKGQQHMLHNHGNIGWSCVLYVNYNPEVHTSTRFLSPYGVGSGRGGGLEWYQPDIKEGDFIIFDSSIPHEALPNESDEKRTIISMNFQTAPMIPIKQFRTK